MTHFKIALGAVAIFSLLFVFATQRKPEPVMARFEEANWDTAVLKKADRLEPKPIVTERIIPDPPERSVPPVVELPVPVQRKVVEKHRRHVSNVCERHGMRKVNYGRRWRCRK